MNRHEFIEQLRLRLRKLPAEEAQDALCYYEQYFDDAGEENELAAIAELGPPANVAAQIIADYAVKEADMPFDQKTAKRGLSTVWIVILSIFAAPVALPLALVFAAFIFMLLVMVLAVVFSFGVTGVALLIAGFLTALISIPLFLQSLSSAIFYLGTGLLSIGLGIPVLWWTVALAKRCFSWLSRTVGNFIKRRAAK